MTTSQNGWSAAPNLPLRPLVVAGEAFSPGIRDDDDVHTVLAYVAQQMHERVEPIVRADFHQADDWGFSYRDNRNDPNALSNHSSGTAIDYNATRHPNGVPTYKTFTTEQIREVHRILAEVDYTVRWGGDYTGTPDSMHFEINTTPAGLRPVAERLRETDEMPYTEKELAGIVRAAVASELKPVADELATIKKRMNKIGENAWERDKKVQALLKAQGVDLDAILEQVADQP